LDDLSHAATPPSLLVSTTTGGELRVWDLRGLGMDPWREEEEDDDGSGGGGGGGSAGRGGGGGWSGVRGGALQV
jgi:hypothetical protein